MRFHDDIFGCIGRTPTFRLRRLSESAGAELLAKAEFLNPGGSIKDRIALAMCKSAEASGRLRPGETIVEATAGNTGIGLAWIAAACGYRFVAVMTEADRGPKVEAMEATGAEVVLLPCGRPWDGDDGPVGVARRLAGERDGLYINQFANPANPAAHEHTTAAEIRDAVGDGLDTIVVGVGSGGTATGLARGLKPAMPGLRVIGVAGQGSYLAGERNGDRIPGITPDFAPEVFDRDLVDHIEIVPSVAAAWAARRLAEIEGVPAGHSSGACLLAAENEAWRRPGSKILMVFSDSVRNYPGLGRR